jgi:hypothetical protein
MPKKRSKTRGTGGTKGNLGQDEAKLQELSEEQLSHMKGGKGAEALKEEKRKEQAKR